MVKNLNIKKSVWDLLQKHIYPKCTEIDLPFDIGNDTLIGTTKDLTTPLTINKPTGVPITVGDRIYFGCGIYNKVLAIYDPLNGTLILTFETPGEVEVNEFTLIKTEDVHVMHGTIIQGNEDLSLIKKSEDKYPLIFQHEITKEDFSVDVNTPVERSATVDLFFLCDANFEKWDIEAHTKYAIKPMRELAEKFINALRDPSSKVNKLTTFSLMDHVKFGVYLSSKGHTERIFNDNLSGVQLQIPLEFLTCNCCK